MEQDNKKVSKRIAENHRWFSFAYKWNAMSSGHPIFFLETWKGIKAAVQRENKDAFFMKCDIHKILTN